MEAASEEMTRERYAREATWFNRVRWQLAYWMSLADYRVSKLGAR
jgi:cardiolipin synthase